MIDCHWSAKFSNILCLAKADQVTGPLKVLLLDSETGDVKVVCDKVSGVPDNVYPTTSVVEDATVYFSGFPQNEHLPKEKLYVLDASSCSTTNQAWGGVADNSVLKLVNFK